MGYLQRFWQWGLRFTSLPFGLDQRLFRLPRGWSLSLGISMRYIVDNSEGPPSTFAGGRLLYSPLDETKMQIRLLKLHAGAPEDVLKTTLITVDLLEAPPYEAISYVWGVFHERGSLFIDDQAVEIHAGLFDALHTMRSRASDRLVWADAICINQSDVYERSHQIRIMGQIYHIAESVAVYLGKPTERTGEGMRALQFFTDRTADLRNPPWTHSALPEMERDVADILTRAWFQRIWTVQEATLARRTTLVCGEHRVSWEGDLATMRSIVFRIKATAISPFFACYGGFPSTLEWTPLLNILETQMRQAARREHVVLQRNQLDLAFDFRHRLSTDSRDRYFAMFGIIENDKGGQLNLAPDYDMTLQELHDRFVGEIQRILEETQS